VHRNALPLLILVFSCSPSHARAQQEATNTAASAGNSKTAQRCGVDQAQPARRVFANSVGKHRWREYRSVSDVPELDLDGGASANLWVGRDGHILISIDEPGEDFAAYTDYCFNKKGQLELVRFELRTAWGWGYRQESPIRNGAIRNEISEFFSTDTKQPVAKPQQADDIPEALRPHFFMKESELPFAKLLTAKKAD
jgi:hypothetical protein